MNIGILTFHNAFNYGAVLQAFSLQLFLESIGHKVEIINYHNTKVDKAYALFRIRGVLRKNPIKSVKYLTISLFRWRKFPVFKNNVYKILNISHRVFSLNDLNIIKKDIIIIGSDQLWNNKITGGYDPFYWADFVRNGKVRAITYAVCMNTDKLKPDDILIIKKKLTNFTSISVRETDLAKILRPLTAKQIYISLDPTFLIDKYTWHDLLKGEKPPIDKPYVLVFAILNRDHVVKTAQLFAASKNMPLVVMDPIAEIRPFTNHFQPMSPFGFISAIAHADYIITSSFHGLAFSIIFNREVYVFGDTGRNERMKSLLNVIGINERFIDGSEIPNFSEIDYDVVESKLEVLRNNSQNYLNKSIYNIFYQ